MFSMQYVVRREEWLALYELECIDSNSAIYF